MSTQYLKNRSFSQSLKNIACWAYWTGGAVYAPGTSRENAPWFEALTGMPLLLNLTLIRGFRLLIDIF